MGPGFPSRPSSPSAERGLRLDRRSQGSGLGLAIVQDICEAYGAQIAFAPATLGGLRVQIRLPGTAPAG